MIISVGSKNPTKVAAVKNLIQDVTVFKGAKVKAIDVVIEEFGHPKTLKETIQGAKDRAKQAFQDCQYSVGIESGLYKAPHTKSGYFETTACAIYDGKNFHLGLSPSYEWPPEIIRLILEGYDGSQAFKLMGITNHPKVGTAKGGIHILTDGYMSRTHLNELAIRMALLPLQNPKHY